MALWGAILQHERHAVQLARDDDRLVLGKTITIQRQMQTPPAEHRMETLAHAVTRDDFNLRSTVADLASVSQQSKERIVAQNRAGRFDACDQTMIGLAADGPCAARQIAGGRVPLGPDLPRLKAQLIAPSWSGPGVQKP